MRLISVGHLFLLNLALQIGSGSARVRRARTTESGSDGRGVTAQLLGDEIDMETIEGVEEVTKLVLLKTDSIPGESDERIDGRYLNSLMETLYTGLRKPFKSVSADILGIFPSFEEIQVRCEKPNIRDSPGKDDSLRIKRQSDLEDALSTKQNGSEIEQSRGDNATETDGEFGYLSSKSSLQVCRAVTNDCLSMDDLVRILPPSIISFDKALVRLCPVMLFRIMNQFCHKSSFPSSSHEDTELITAYRSGKIQGPEGVSKRADNNSIKLNTLQMLKNLHSSDELGPKKPQKLHKKLKTQTAYKSNGHLNGASLQQHGVDEQLLKIRLKLSEPSIEKVWIFSLLFVVLSIVVSMGGLIVLPFVKKTTRRRILTLFEGLAVGGLTGSATLHMFPQAFGLVDENYHKYFWRIFVVFLGIYLCYLCERTIKIFKVIRAKMRRRSKASLIDMDYCYGFPSVNREIRTGRSKIVRIFEPKSSSEMSDSYEKHKNWTKKQHDTHDPDNFKGFLQQRYMDGRMKHKQVKQNNKTHKIETRSYEKGTEKKVKKVSLKPGDKKRLENFRNWDDLRRYLPSDAKSETDQESLSAEIYLNNNATRARLIKLLKSVQQQFSPVYAVYSDDYEGPGANAGKNRKSSRPPGYVERGRAFKRDTPSPNTGGKRWHIPFFGRFSSGNKVSMKRQMKQKEVETMLYHRNRMEQLKNSRDNGDPEEDFLQQRLSSVKDVAAERQDQDNAARMSVDTVAWMIVFGDAVLNVIDGLSIGAAFERNILAGISISVAVMLEEVTHRLGTFAVLIRAGMSMQQSLLCTFLSACALFPGLCVGILLSDATEDATPYIFCAAGGIFLYMVSNLSEDL